MQDGQEQAQQLPVLPGGGEDLLLPRAQRAAPRQVDDAHHRGVARGLLPPAPGLPAVRLLHQLALQRGLLVPLRGRRRTLRVPPVLPPRAQLPLHGQLPHGRGPGPAEPSHPALPGGLPPPAQQHALVRERALHPHATPHLRTPQPGGGGRGHNLAAGCVGRSVGAAETAPTPAADGRDGGPGGHGRAVQDLQVPGPLRAPLLRRQQRLPARRHRRHHGDLRQLRQLPAVGHLHARLHRRAPLLARPGHGPPTLPPLRLSPALAHRSGGRNLRAT